GGRAQELSGPQRHACRASRRRAAKSPRCRPAEVVAGDGRGREHARLSNGTERSAGSGTGMSSMNREAGRSSFSLLSPPPRLPVRSRAKAWRYWRKEIDDEATTMEGLLAAWLFLGVSLPAAALSVAFVNPGRATRRTGWRPRRRCNR